MDKLVFDITKPLGRQHFINSIYLFLSLLDIRFKLTYKFNLELIGCFLGSLIYFIFKSCEAALRQSLVFCLILFIVEGSLRIKACDLFLVVSCPKPSYKCKVPCRSIQSLLPHSVMSITDLLKASASVLSGIFSDPWIAYIHAPVHRES